MDIQDQVNPIPYDPLRDDPSPDVVWDVQLHSVYGDPPTHVALYRTWQEAHAHAVTLTNFETGVHGVCYSRMLKGDAPHE